MKLLTFTLLLVFVLPTAVLVILFGSLTLLLPRRIKKGILRYYRHELHSIRMELYHFGRLEKLHPADTLFLLEAIDIRVEPGPGQEGGSRTSH
ncbi:MAG TPA: hypothetical protein DCE41_08720 [Cytophagales bacterium]|nr:hypothetical protein [Cytophagales bacterium]HAA19033.1 hypothetical protein [Cytophagales bacterium]HAP64544.1 hypothetical protein [Cytophagales bacterium]